MSTPQDPAEHSCQDIEKRPVPPELMPWLRIVVDYARRNAEQQAQPQEQSRADQQ